MCKRQLSDVVIFWALLLIVLHGNVEASPTKRLSRMAREVYPEIEPENEGNQAQVCIVGDLVYGADETVPAEQPCLKCKCQPPGVQCETIQCVKKPGCRAIHKPNKCCPDYQCECEHNGKFYGNGEKLETPPGGECRVCYCSGGEVQCADVSCYIRKDCEGKTVPGKCCPKYDHCPPIDTIPGRSPFTTEINLDKNSYEPWSEPANVTEVILSPTSIDTQDDNKIPDTNYYGATTPSHKLSEVDDLQKEAFLPKITIQEIIPERKEIPVTAPPKVELESQGTLIIEEAEEFLNHSNDIVVTDADADSSEISEIFQHPPPVLRIGDKLLFLKKGEFVHEKDTSTPNSVITIIGAEGLQRGGFEDSGEIHEIKIEDTPRPNEDNATTLPGKVEALSDDNAFTSNPDQNLDPISNISELNTAESTHILSLVKRKNKPSTTTTTTTETYTTTSTTESEIVSPTSETNVVQDASVSNSNKEASIDISSTTDNSDLLKTTTDALDTPTTEEIKNLTEAAPIPDVDNITQIKELDLTNVKVEEVILEQNPAYPPIPDIMTLNTDDTSQRFDTEVTEKDHGVYEQSTESPTMKILPEVLEIRSNKTVPTNTSHSEWLKINTETLINYKAALPDELLNQPAPTDIEDTTDDLNDLNTELITTTESGTTNEITDANTVTTESVTDYDKKLDLLTTISDIPEKEESARSIETIEESSDEDRESTTKRVNHELTVSTNENASIENAKEDSSEAEDMASTSDTTNNDSSEGTTPAVLDEADMIDKEWNEENKNSTNGNSDDVEFVDAVKTKKTVIERNTDDTLPEHLPKPEKLILPAKVVSKRETSNEEINILKQLSADATAEVTERNISSEEEEKESEDIFKQLLEDSSTEKPKRQLTQKELDASLQRITRVFVQNSLRGSVSASDLSKIQPHVHNSSTK